MDVLGRLLSVRGAQTALQQEWTADRSAATHFHRVTSSTHWAPAILSTPPSSTADSAQWTCRRVSNSPTSSPAAKSARKDFEESVPSNSIIKVYSKPFDYFNFPAIHYKFEGYYRYNIEPRAVFFLLWWGVER